MDFFRSEEKPNLLCCLLVLRCSMCMLVVQINASIPYGSMQMPIAWNGLSMPTEGCSVCMPIAIINFKVRGVKWDSVPYMMKIILTYILLCVGLLTLMYIDSWIVLAWPWSYLLIMLKLSWVVLCLVWMLCTWMGEGSFRCSLYLSPKVLDVSPMYSSSHASSPH